RRPQQDRPPALIHELLPPASTGVGDRHGTTAAIPARLDRPAAGQYSGGESAGGVSPPAARRTGREVGETADQGPLEPRRPACWPVSDRYKTARLAAGQCDDRGYHYRHGRWAS